MANTTTRNDPDTGEAIPPCVCCGHPPWHTVNLNADGVCLGCEQSGEVAPGAGDEFDTAGAGEWAGWTTEDASGAIRYSRIHLWAGDKATCGAAPPQYTEWVAECDSCGDRCLRCERSANQAMRR